MRAHFTLQGSTYVADLTKPADLSFPLRHGSENPSAWYVSPPVFEPVEAPSFIGRVALGGSVNFYQVHLNPHGNGTHTECIGHITPEHHSLSDLLPNGLLPCQVVTIPAEFETNDWVLRQVPDTIPGIEAIAIRTSPNPNPGGTTDFSGTNPPYFDATLLDILAKRGISHLLTDLPSVDREEDGGLLLGHKAWWQYPAQPRMAATITEMAHLPDYVRDGIYLLNLQVPNWMLDAAPSRPVLFPAEESTAW